MRWGDQGTTGRSDRRDRLTVQESAQRLGISEEAVRGRIKRGTLASERHEGHVYVLVERPVGDESSAQDRPVEDRTDALIAELQDRVRSLEEANSENRRIIAALTQRIPAIEGAREAPVSDENASAGADTRDARATSQTGAEHAQSADEQPARERSWWRRVFGS